MGPRETDLTARKRCRRPRPPTSPSATRTGTLEGPGRREPSPPQIAATHRGRRARRPNRSRPDLGRGAGDTGPRATGAPSGGPSPSCASGAEDLSARLGRATQGSGHPALDLLTSPFPAWKGSWGRGFQRKRLLSPRARRRDSKRHSQGLRGQVCTPDSGPQRGTRCCRGQARGWRGGRRAPSTNGRRKQARPPAGSPGGPWVWRCGRGRCQP